MIGRYFVKASATLTSCVAGTALFPIAGWTKYEADENINIIGPKKGFSPHIGTLESMLTWTRAVVMEPVKNMTVNQLDYLHDAKANTIEALLLHLAATEKYYQLYFTLHKNVNVFIKELKVEG